jgi:hypothetical protein
MNTLQLSEFDVTDLGAGVQSGFRLTPAIAVDGTFAWIPSSGDFSSTLFENQQRMLGVAGIRAGLTRGRVELFGKARPGFLRFSHQDSVVCILIFPVPLSCQLAAGYTAFAFDAGAGASINLDRAGRFFLRVDGGDLLLRYGLQAYRRQGETTDGFVSHNFNINVGVGRKF